MAVRPSEGVESWFSSDLRGGISDEVISRFLVRPIADVPTTGTLIWADQFGVPNELTAQTYHRQVAALS